MSRRVRNVLLLVAAIAVALVVVARNRESTVPVPEPVPEPAAPEVPQFTGIRPEPGPPLPPTVDPPVPFVSGAGPHPIESGQTIGIESEALPTESLLLLDLRMPADILPEEPSLRVIATDGRLLEMVAEVAEETGQIRLPLDPGWLRPGRYVIEVKTLERSHFPLRRYALEVR